MKARVRNDEWLNEIGHMRRLDALRGRINRAAQDDDDDMLPILLRARGRVRDDEWLTELGRIWPACMNIFRFREALMDSPFGRREGEVVREMMVAKEEAALADLPERVTIWRGCYENNINGFSWSLSEKAARAFPIKHGWRGWQQGVAAVLARATIDKATIAALCLEKGEAEVIVWPAALVGAGVTVEVST